MQKQTTSNLQMQCEKHSKKEEALEKLRNGAKFDEVARDFSEDKARQGMIFSYIDVFLFFISFPCTLYFV